MNKLEATSASKEQHTSRCSSSDLSPRPKRLEEGHQSIRKMGHRTKRPKGRLKKKQKFNYNLGNNYQLAQACSIQYLIGYVSNLPDINNIPKNSKQLTLLKRRVEGKRSTLQ